MTPKLDNILSIDTEDGGVPSSRDAREINDDGTPNDAVAFHHVRGGGRDCAWSVKNDLGKGDSVA